MSLKLEFLEMSVGGYGLIQVTGVSGLRGNWTRRSRFVGLRLEGCQAIKKRAWRVEIRVNV